MEKVFEKMRKEGLYDPSFEHDNCGIGAIIQIDGTPSHSLVEDAWNIEQERMPQVKQETVLESLHRYLINSLIRF